MTRSSRNGGSEGWRSPAGISAIAGAVGTVIALVALFLSFGGDDEGGAGTATDSTGTSLDTSPSTSPSATPTDEPDTELPAVARAEQIVPALREVARAALPSEEESGAVERRGVAAFNADFPKAWPADIGPWLADESDDRLGLAIVASTDEDGFYTGTVAGFFVAASSLTDMDPEAYLENRETGWETTCVRVGENVIDGPDGTGHYEVYRDCHGSSVVVEVAYRGEYSIYVHARLTDAAQVGYLQALLESIHVVPPVPTESNPNPGSDPVP